MSVDIPDNFEDAVMVIVREEMQKYAGSYQGEVKEINDDETGLVLIHSDMYGTEDNDKDSYIRAWPSRMMSSVFPDVGDIVWFRFPTLTDDYVEYYAEDPIQYNRGNAAKNKKVIFEYDSDYSIIFDTEEKKFTINAAGKSITLDKDLFKVDVPDTEHTGDVKTGGDTIIEGDTTIEGEAEITLALTAKTVTNGIGQSLAPHTHPYDNNGTPAVTSVTSPV